MYPWQVKRVC